MKHIAKIAIASCVMAALTFAITYFVEWPSWRVHDELYRQQLAQAKEAMRRGEDPFLYQEIDVYCGLTPIQLARNLSFLVLIIAPTLLLIITSAVSAIFGVRIPSICSVRSCSKGRYGRCGVASR